MRNSLSSYSKRLNLHYLSNLTLIIYFVSFLDFSLILLFRGQKSITSLETDHAKIKIISQTF